MKWVFHSIPHPGEFGYDTWPTEAYKTPAACTTGASPPSTSGGIAFISSAAARFDFYGGDRPGNNLFGNSLVALDARTGKRHLATAARASRSVGLRPAPGAEAADDPPKRPQHRRRRAGDEAGLPVRVRAQDRTRRSGRSRNGRCRSPTFRESIPRPTQPFPTRPAPFADQTFTERDINPHLPAAEREALVQRFKFLRNEGLFTPPSFEGSIAMPGHNGGANFGAAPPSTRSTASSTWSRRTCP